MPLNSGAISYTKAGTGPAVLLSPGLGSTRRTWQQAIRDLARSHPVIALTLGDRRINVVGHSLGGGVALELAYQLPERIERAGLMYLPPTVR
jgi:pimeloyl-ACP methyl ester carboxylesterase